MMEKHKTALITGITGQDGSYLTEYLLSKGYTVHGIVRRHNLNGLPLGQFMDNNPDADVHLHYGDLQNTEQISALIHGLEDLNEIYHLGAQSHVHVSFETPEHTGNVGALGTTRLLEAIRRGKNHDIRFYNAATSELYGLEPPPQSETTKFAPRSPYACAKLYAYWMTKNYRDGYGLFASSGILFNHEGARRGENFVTRKITKSIAMILAGKQKYLELGDLSTKRDWGFAPEYVEAMHKLLQLNKPDDFVIGTGETHSVKQFVNETFKYAGLKVSKYVKINQEFIRPTDVNELRADITKAYAHFGWRPHIRMKELARIMVDADMRKQGLDVIGDGDKLIKKYFPKRWWNND
jgi:GDPmannose 4,6-dehydratase